MIEGLAGGRVPGGTEGQFRRRGVGNRSTYVALIFLFPACRALISLGNQLPNIGPPMA